MRKTRGPSSIVRYSHLGIQFALVILLGIWAGAQLDKRLSTSWFTLVGTFVGAGLGFYLLYRETGGGGPISDEEPSSEDSADPGDHVDRPGGGGRGDHPSDRGDRGA